MEKTKQTFWRYHGYLNPVPDSVEDGVYVYAVRIERYTEKGTWEIVDGENWRGLGLSLGFYWGASDDEAIRHYQLLGGSLGYILRELSTKKTNLIIGQA